jgi:hypothetical protein
MNQGAVRKKTEAASAVFAFLQSEKSAREKVLKRVKAQ